MKQYKVILKDKREAFVEATGHLVESDQRRFTINDKIIPDIFFKEDQVIGVSIEIADIDNPFPGGGYVSG